jgi:phosphoserine aminotransferase
MTDTKQKVYNFNAGPAALPQEVLEKAQAELLDYRGLGYSILEASHRSPEYEAINAGAEANLRKILGISDAYEVLFLQGGASLQFAMVPMNLGVPGKPMVYANTGTWASKAISEAKLFGTVELMYDGKPGKFAAIGHCEEWSVRQDAAYAYVCSNNTIYGTQYHSFPDAGAVPLVADMSSDFASRRVDVSRFGLIFAGAQKNIGPAGVTVVILRKDLVARAPATVPTMLKYSTHIPDKSLYNTPPVFSVYILHLVTEWILSKGGIGAIERINATKSQTLYEFIDASSFYRGVAEPADRSRMNVCFRLPTEDLEKKFASESAKAGLVGLKGHRSVGGMRASLYNAMPLEGVSRLIDFMTDFETRNS